MIEYNRSILNKLVEIDFQPQGSVGESPDKWAKEMELYHTFELPKKILTRAEVREICQSDQNDNLFGYLCAMAWGAQGKGPGGRKHVQSAWDNRSRIHQNINILRKGTASRREAYNLFNGSGEIAGLGPAYFTKLLYFFHPRPEMYIMDQWTTKPILLLTGLHIIRHTNAGPTRLNEGINYELFCLIIDDLTKPLNAKSGEEVEQRLFSVGSIRKKPRGAFRQLIFERWQKRPPFPKYQEKLVLDLMKKLDDCFTGK